MIPLDLYCEQSCLPILMWTRYRLHGEEMPFGVFENQRSDGTGRGQAPQPRQAQRFPMAARRIREPVFLHAQLRERLLEHPALASQSFYQHGAVGDAAWKRCELRHFLLPDAARLAQ